MTSQLDLHYAHLIVKRYPATLRYLTTSGWHQWHGLRWQPIDDDMLIYLTESLLIDSAPAPSRRSGRPVFCSLLLPYLKSLLKLASCQPVLCNLYTAPAVALFLLHIVTGMVNLRHWTLLLLTVLLPIVSSKMQIALIFKVINAKAVEGWWRVSGRLVEGYGGLVEGSKWLATRLSRHSQHISVEG